MTPEEMRAMEEVLLADRARMLRNAADERDGLRERDRSDVGDSLDDSSDEAMASTQLRLRDREKWLLSKIEEALARMREGTYGQCDSCGEEIGFGRLKARPVATLCIECKELEEREERTRLDPRELEVDEGGSRGD